MAASMTYNSLVADIISYAERAGDVAFVAQVPQLIMLAENRIALEAKGLGLQKSVTDNLVMGSPVLAKPARWRETVSLQTSTEAGNSVRNILLARSLEFCREFWPDDSNKDLPRFYADYDWAHWLICPTPAAAYSYELVFYERPQPLDGTNTTNWTTQYAPQLLLAACMMEAQPYLKNMERGAMWEAAYNQQIASFSTEDRRRIVDRSTVRTKDAKSG